MREQESCTGWHVIHPIHSRRSTRQQVTGSAGYRSYMPRTSRAMADFYSGIWNIVTEMAQMHVCRIEDTHCSTGYTAQSPSSRRPCPVLKNISRLQDAKECCAVQVYQAPCHHESVDYRSPLGYAKHHIDGITPTSLKSFQSKSLVRSSLFHSSTASIILKISRSTVS